MMNVQVGTSGIGGGRAERLFAAADQSWHLARTTWSALQESACARATDPAVWAMESQAWEACRSAASCKMAAWDLFEAELVLRRDQVLAAARAGEIARDVAGSQHDPRPMARQDADTRDSAFDRAAELGAERAVRRAVERARPAAVDGGPRDEAQSGPREGRQDRRQAQPTRDALDDAGASVASRSSWRRPSSVGATALAEMPAESFSIAWQRPELHAPETPDAAPVVQDLAAQDLAPENLAQDLAPQGQVDADAGPENASPLDRPGDAIGDTVDMGGDMVSRIRRLLAEQEVIRQESVNDEA